MMWLWYRGPGVGILIGLVDGTSVTLRAGIGDVREMGHQGQLLLHKLVCTATHLGTYHEILGP